MKKTILAAILLSGMLAGCNQKQTNDNNMKQELELTQEWDKVFPLSDKVTHRKVTFKTQYGLTLAADLYEPKVESSELRDFLLLLCLVLSEPSRNNVADSMP